MDLFDISSEEPRNLLFDYATEIFGDGSILNVKGRESGKCQFIDNAQGPFVALYGNCYEDFYSFCVFTNPNPQELDILADGEGEFFVYQAGQLLLTDINLLTVNATSCDEVKDLYDESTNYIKTVCLVLLYKDYDDAVAKCRSYGMSLYNVDAPEAKKTLLDFSNSRFRPSLGATLYVEGKTSEGCAVVANKEGLFDVLSVSCTNKTFFYCQYSRALEPDVPGNHEK
jgi:hypothetical protein